MIVNNVDLVTLFGATIIEKNFGSSEIIAYIDWLDSAIDPTEEKESKFKFSQIRVVLLIEGENETEILTKMSNIKAMSKKGTLKFSDIDYFYDIALDDSSYKRINTVAYELTLSYKSAYKYLGYITETMNQMATKVIAVSGNTKTPAIVEITPSVDIIDIVINGFGSSDITINNLTANKKVIIDGENGLVTVDGINKYDDTDMWEFPSLEPGANTITVTRTTCDIAIKYKPRFI